MPDRLIEVMLYGIGYFRIIRGIMSNGIISIKKFNESINSWDVSSVTSMCSMFYDTLFNKPPDRWDVGNVKDMEQMFTFTE